MGTAGFGELGLLPAYSDSLLQLVCVCLTVIPFLFFPVLSASAVASGRLGNITDLPDDILVNMTITEKRFYLGSFVGFLVELGAGFMIGGDTQKTNNF